MEINGRGVLTPLGTLNTSSCVGGVMYCVVSRRGFLRMAGRPRPPRTVGLRLRVKSDGLHQPWTIIPPEGCRPRAGERMAPAMPSGGRTVGWLAD